MTLRLDTWTTAGNCRESCHRFTYLGSLAQQQSQLHSTVVLLTMSLTLAPFFLLSLFHLCSSQSVHGPEARLITNGSLTDVRDHPWVAKLDVLADIYYPLKLASGSGTILSNRWILTAAHIFDIPEDSTIVAIKIRVGISNIAEKGQVTDVELYRCHPLYEPFGTYYDICLVKTADPLEFDDNVQPVHLPTKSDDNSTLINLAGFGSIGENALGGSLELRTTFMFVDNGAICEKYGYYNDSVDICLYDPVNTAACSGDSGSGMIATRDDGSNVIVGVLTRSNCIDESFGPRVSAYLEWIKSVMSQYA